MPSLSVVIPSYQRCPLLRRVLALLGQQTLPADAFEVIVAVDGSTDGTIAMLEQLATPYALCWTNGRHVGAGGARNRGAARARGRVILFLDDDILPAPALLAEHLALHGANGDGAVACVGLGRIELPAGQRLTDWERYLYGRFEIHYAKLARPDYRPDFWDCLSGNVSVSRSLLARSGGFAPAFSCTRHEDIEWGYRLARLGAAFVYQPAALGYHSFHKSLAEGLHGAAEDGVSAARLARLHPELAAGLLHARWRRYPRPLWIGWRQLLAYPAARRQLIALAGRGLVWAAERPSRPAAQKRLFQLAYHLHFWEGVRREAGPGELAGWLAG